MVEGPGCKIKGEKIRGKLLKQKAITVAGNAVDRVSIVLFCTCWWSRALQNIRSLTHDQNKNYDSP